MVKTTLRVANDLGNGYMKITINGESFRFPSVIAAERPQDVFDPISFANENEKKAYMDRFLEHLDASVQSPAVKTTGRMLVGPAAVTSALQTQGFDVNDLSGKSETDLALLLTLPVLAGFAARAAYQKTGEIPSNLDVRVIMTTALPILEGKRDDTTKRYMERYTAHDHVVTLHNFADMITAHLHFDLAIVALEGEAAQYELKRAPEDLANAIKADFDAHYPDLASLVTAEELAKTENVMGIDIGEGTTDFPVFTNGAINMQASTSVPNGYGNALEEAIAELKAKQFNIHNRTELQVFLNQNRGPLGLSRQRIASQAVSDQLDLLSSAILDGVSLALRKASTSIDLIVVYGGGAAAMDHFLRGPLMEKTRAFNGGENIPVIFVDAVHAPFMNENGLSLILSRVAGGAAHGQK